MTNLKAAVLTGARVLLIFANGLVIAWRQTLANIKSTLLHLALIQEALRNVHSIFVELTTVRHQWRFVVGLQLQFLRSRVFHLN